MKVYPQDKVIEYHYGSRLLLATVDLALVQETSCTTLLRYGMYPSQTTKILHQIASQFLGTMEVGHRGQFKANTTINYQDSLSSSESLIGHQYYIPFIYSLVIMDWFLLREVKCLKINKVVFASVTVYFSCIPTKDIPWKFR